MSNDNEMIRRGEAVKAIRAARNAMQRGDKEGGWPAFMEDAIAALPAVTAPQGVDALWQICEIETVEQARVVAAKALKGMGQFPPTPAQPAPSEWNAALSETAADADIPDLSTPEWAARFKRPLAEALAVPEVAALVKAVRLTIDFGSLMDSPPDREFQVPRRCYEALDAALRAIGEDRTDAK